MADVFVIACEVRVGDVMLIKNPVRTPLLFSNDGIVHETRIEVDVIVVPITGAG